MARIWRGETRWADPNPARGREQAGHDARDLGRAFEAGEDVGPHVDWSRTRRPNDEVRRGNVDFPAFGAPASATEAT